MEVTLRDFQPINQWKEVRGWTSSIFFDGNPMFLVDQSTKGKYLNESRNMIRFKCTLLFLASPFVHGGSGVKPLMVNVIKILSLSHFWKKGEGGVYGFSARLLRVKEDLLKILKLFIVLVGLQLSALLGCFMPLDGRKLYASFERWQYGEALLAPCFQPEPTRHFFGGDIHQKNAF